MSGLQTILGLYRDVLRVHRQKLLAPMRIMGDAYARSEFQAHLRSTKVSEGQWREFFEQWQGYLTLLRGAEQQGAADTASLGGAAEAISHTADRLEMYATPEQKLKVDALKKEVEKLMKEQPKADQE